MIFAKPVLADWPAVAGTSATPSYSIVTHDTRILHLRSYLDSYHSPLSDEAEFIIAEADRLNLDWRLITAIAGAESTFGKHMPSNSYNGWGWAIFTGNTDGKHFASWRDGIRTVSEGLRYNYMDKGAKTIEQIGRTYAASPHWANSVRFFLNSISAYSPNDPHLLAVTI